MDVIDVWERTGGALSLYVMRRNGRPFVR